MRKNGLTRSEPVPLEWLTSENIARFNSMYSIDKNGCWVWNHGLCGYGYGTFHVHGDGIRKQVLAHRFSYSAFKCAIQPGFVIDHLCKNPKCVNPEHMEVVTSKTNLLRGDGFAGKNHRKTVCKNGHPLSGSNVAIRKRDGCVMRICKTCRRDYHKKYSADHADKMREYAANYRERKKHL